MRLKDKSVKIKCLTIFMSEKLKALDILIKKYTDRELVITSGCELSAKHMQGSRHYTGNAIDIRTWDLYALPANKLTEFSRELRKIFPKGKYDIVPESTHMHIEFDPKVKKVSSIPIKELPLKYKNYELTYVYVPELKQHMPLYIRIIASKQLKGTMIRIGKTAINVASRYYAGITIFQPKQSTVCMNICNTIMSLMKRSKE